MSDLGQLALEWRDSGRFSAIFPPGMRAGGKLDIPLSSGQKALWQKLQRYAILHIKDDSLLPDILSGLRSDSRIEYVGKNSIYSVDQLIPNDSLWPGQWPMERLGIPQAWDYSKGDSVLVGVIDTGIEFTHPDLRPRLYINPKEDINGNGIFDPWPVSQIRQGRSGDLDGIDQDNNGFADDVIGYDFVDQYIPNIGDYGGQDPVPADEHGHGTSVAGIIGAATNNAIGLAAIAPGCRLLTMRAFDATGNAEEDDIARAIIYAALQGTRVLCMSFGDIVYSPLTEDALSYAASMGCVLIASAGNDGSSLRRYPASYPQVIAVGATNQQDNRAAFSSFGSHLALCAPGVAIPTTALGGRYRSFQGTSAAAPFVAGAAALLLGQDNSLSRADIRGILQASCTDLGPTGWDTEYGSGRLNILAALQSSGKHNSGILFPVNDVELKSNGIIAITGSTIVPLFRSWTLQIGPGEMPADTSWTMLVKDSNQRVSQDTLALLNTAQFKDGIYTLRLRIGLTTGSAIEHRVRCMIVSAATPFTLTESVQIDTAWLDQRRVLVISASFSRICRAHLEISQNGITEFLTDDDKMTALHHYIVDARPGQTLSARLIAYTPGNTDSVIRSFSCTGDGYAAPQTGILAKPYTLPPTFMLDIPGNEYSTGRPTIIGTDYSTGTFGFLKIYGLQNGQFITVDSIRESWIPRGTGDSNGDGIPEILVHSLGEARLFQQKGNSAFGDTLFSEKRIGAPFSRIQEFWSAGMHDINGDGRPEIIGFSDTSCLVFTYSGGTYTLLGSAPNDTPRGPDKAPNGMRPPAVAVGDFDGDGNIELAYGDTDGDYLIFEYRNGRFEKTYTLLTEQEGGTEFTAAADLDGDGKSELLLGGYSSPAPQNREYGTPLWTFRVLGSTGNDAFIIRDIQKFYGVRAGLEYRNGIHAANADNLPGDEVFLCLFPNLYIFQWDKEQNKLMPLWNYPLCYSNTAYVADIDGDGTKEFGFGDGSRVLFAALPEKNSQLRIPRNVIAAGLNDSTAKIEWQGLPDAAGYEIYMQKNPDDNTLTADFLGFTTQDSLLVDTLQSNSFYRFFIRTVESGGGTSAFSAAASCFLHPPARLNKLRGIAARNNPASLLIHFTQPLKSSSVAGNSFRLLNQATGIYTAISTIQPAGDSSLLLFPEQSLLPNTRYMLYTAAFTDRSGMMGLADSIEFSTDENGAVRREVFITGISVINRLTLHLFFSENLDAVSASQKDNYTLIPNGMIVNASPAQNKVVLQLDPSRPLAPLGRDYLLQAKQLKGESDAPLSTGAGSMIGFTLTGQNGQAFCYPQPWSKSKNNVLTFAGLPARANITIMTIQGEIIASVQENDGNGGTIWDGTLKDGSQIPSGIYLYSVDGTDDKGASIQYGPHKFSIIR
jgi:hypothetical protein